MYFATASLDMNLIGIYNSSVYFLSKVQKCIQKCRVLTVVVMFPRQVLFTYFQIPCNSELLKGSISAIFRGIAAARIDGKSTYMT